MNKSHHRVYAGWKIKKRIPKKSPRLRSLTLINEYLSIQSLPKNPPKSPFKKAGLNSPLLKRGVGGDFQGFKILSKSNLVRNVCNINNKTRTHSRAQSDLFDVNTFRSRRFCFLKVSNKCFNV